MIKCAKISKQTNTVVFITYFETGVDDMSMFKLD